MALGDEVEMTCIGCIIMPGMELTKAKQYRARVSEKYYLSESEKYLLVKLELVEPSEIEFAAGQHVSIKVSEGGERRSYSIASTPDVKHGVTLVAEMVPGGRGTEFLRKVEIGGEVELLGPLGRFVINVSTLARRHVGTKRLFVATGSGIVPIYSMICDLLINRGEQRPMRLHWGMRSEQSMFWFDNLERLSEEHPNFVFDPVLSQPSQEWSLCSGHVQDCLRRDFAKGLTGWEGYICGNPEMVEEVGEQLYKLGMPGDRIHREKFA